MIPKCRGRRLDGEWVYGYHAVWQNRHYIAEQPYEAGFKGGDVLTNSLGGFMEVDPTTVGMFTTWPDRTGAEICQGDILDTNPDGHKRFLRTVEWNAALGRFQALFSDRSGLQLFTRKQCTQYEVIGNIHEHAHLLEAENG